jgi:hypothetical protein
MWIPRAVEKEGAQIIKRVQELLAVPVPTQKVEAPSTNDCSENEPASRIT